MRMRRKKNLDERLSNVSDKLIVIDRQDRNFNTAQTYKDYLDFKSIFGNDNPVYLEIGCGKGGFSCQFAKQNPDINLIAVEKAANVIVNGCEQAKKDKINNLIFMKCSAEYLPSYFKEESISRIFLNFSCPFPKKKYANHRLTAKPFLDIYKQILKKDAEIHMKTDNQGLFEFTIEQASCNGFALKNVSLDLQKSDFENNIETEYEHKFSSMGLPIYRLEMFIK